MSWSSLLSTFDDEGSRTSSSSGAAIVRREQAPFTTMAPTAAITPAVQRRCIAALPHRRRGACWALDEAERALGPRFPRNCGSRSAAPGSTRRRMPPRKPGDDVGCRRLAASATAHSRPSTGTACRSARVPTFFVRHWRGCRSPTRRPAPVARPSGTALVAPADRAPSRPPQSDSMAAPQSRGADQVCWLRRCWRRHRRRG